jgi:hypothetical protein
MTSVHDGPLFSAAEKSKMAERVQSTHVVLGHWIYGMDGELYPARLLKLICLL